MLCVGLTGGIGAGKTTIARLFEKKGIFIVEADPIVHKLLLPKSIIWEQIVSQWGPSILIPEENKINREKLAEIVFNEDNSLKWLLDILYPTLKQEVNKEKTRASNMGALIFLFEASQILEAGWNAMFDVIVLVKTRFDLRQKRLLNNGRLDSNQIRIRMRFQWPDWVKMRYADFWIDNSGPLCKTMDVVYRIYDQLVEFSKEEYSNKY